MIDRSEELKRLALELAAFLPAVRVHEGTMTYLDKIQIQRAEEQVENLDLRQCHDPDSWDVPGGPPIPHERSRKRCLVCGKPTRGSQGYCRLHSAIRRRTGQVDSAKDYLIWPIHKGHIEREDKP